MSTDHPECERLANLLWEYGDSAYSWEDAKSSGLHDRYVSVTYEYADRILALLRPEAASPLEGRNLTCFCGELWDGRHNACPKCGGKYVRSAPAAQVDRGLVAETQALVRCLRVWVTSSEQGDPPSASLVATLLADAADALERAAPERAGNAPTLPQE